MKRIVSAAIAVTFVGAMLSPVLAQDRPNATPPKTMGDEGKLPPTAKVSPPDMGATDSAEIGQRKRMGDEGVLPATKGMSGTTPQMNPPAQPEEK